MLECYAECSRACKNWKLVPARAEHQACLNAMPSAAELARIESSNSAFCSSGIAARHCLNKSFCIIIVDLINCLCLYCWSLHSGSSCQLPEGKPMAAMLYFIKIKRPAHLSIVERLGGFSWCKGTAFIWVVQEFGKKNCARREKNQ